MTNEETFLHFFLGANTPLGFVSEFEQLHSPQQYRRLICIQGAPGSGKSTLLSAIAKEFAPQAPGQLIHCSFDPSSLDAVAFPQLGLAAMDITEPHPLRLKAPGGYESVISLHDCCDDTALQEQQEELLRLGQEESLSVQRYHRFLSAAGTILGDTYRIALEYTDTEKIRRFVQRLFYKEIKLRLNRTAHEQIRFLSTGTPTGVLMYPDNIAKLCDKVYLIEDDYGAVSRLLNAQIRATALECGYDVISCPCPMSHLDKIDHLFIPALSLGFFTSNRFHPLKGVTSGKTVSFQRFTSKDIRSRHDRLHFNRKAAAQIFLEAGSHLDSAQQTREKAENIYSSAMDFARVDEKTNQLLTQLRENV